MLWSQLVCSARGMLKRIDHPSNVMVFKDATFVFLRFGNSYVHHCLAQLVCPNHQVWKRHAKRGVDSTEETIAEIRFPTRFYRINVSWSKDVNPRKSGGQERILRLALITCKRRSAPARRVCASATQERERRQRAASVENCRKLDRVADGYGAELLVRDGARISTQAKHGCVLTSERLCECRAVREVSVYDFIQLGMRDIELSANDRRYAFHRRMSQGVAKSVSTNHSRRTYKNKALLSRGCHESARSSVQST